MEMPWFKSKANLANHPIVGRNYGYAKYASNDSAQLAISTLHGQELCGMRLKVIEADPPKDGEESSRKRHRP